MKYYHNSFAIRKGRTDKMGIAKGASQPFCYKAWYHAALSDVNVTLYYAWPPHVMDAENP